MNYSPVVDAVHDYFGNTLRSGVMVLHVHDVKGVLCHGWGVFKLLECCVNDGTRALPILLPASTNAAWSRQRTDTGSPLSHLTQVSLNSLQIALWSRSGGYLIKQETLA